MTTSTHRRRAAARVLLENSVAALIGSTLLASCGRAPSLPPRAANVALADDCIARVAEVAITREAFEHEWQRRNRQSKQEVLDEMIRSAALLARAKAAGYDRDPQVAARINEFIVARFQEEQLAKQSEPRVSPAEVEAYYHANAARFTVPEAVRAAVFFAKCSRHATDEKRAELKRKTELLLDEARNADNAAFRRLVEQRSEDQATRYIGGDTGWLQAGNTSGRWPGAVIKAAFALSQPGEFAPLVATENGFYIVRLTERVAARLRPIEEVRDGIAYQLTTEKRQRVQRDFVERMKSGLRIEINASLLESIPSRAPLREEKPPVLPRS